jgi:beta-glucosidase
MSFPNGFVWGAASASYQVEGASKQDGRGASVWDTFSHTPGKTFGGHTGDEACDAYHRYPEDIAILSRLGIPHYRFSIAWPRIFPDGRTLRARGFDYYDRLVDFCLESGVTPWITLFHWDTPQALEDAGGWHSRETAELAGLYAAAVAEHFKNRVKHYFTLNEPQCFIGLGYETGLHAPGKTLEPADLFICWHNAMLAHGLMAKAVRSSAADVQIGIASAGQIAFPHSKSQDDVSAAKRATFSTSAYAPSVLFTHQAFLDPILLERYPDEPFFTGGSFNPADFSLIHQPIDFVGLNCYSGVEAAAGEDGETVIVPPYRGYPRTALKWPVTPEILRYGPLWTCERYHLPVYITENGLSCNDRIFLDDRVHDPERVDFLHRYLCELRKACADGADVRGYFHWSLTDNFEWSNGYKERFGLVYVDYPTQRRILKDSAFWYAGVVKTNGAEL